MLVFGAIFLASAARAQTFRRVTPSCPCTNVAPDETYTCTAQRAFGKCYSDFMLLFSERLPVGFCQFTCGRCPRDLEGCENAPLPPPIPDFVSDACGSSCNDTTPHDEADFSCEEQRDFGKCFSPWMIEGRLCEKTCGRCAWSRQDGSACSVRVVEEPSTIAEWIRAAAEALPPPPSPEPEPRPRPSPSQPPAQGPTETETPSPDLADIFASLQALPPALGLVSPPPPPIEPPPPAPDRNCSDTLLDVLESGGDHQTAFTAELLRRANLTSAFNNSRVQSSFLAPTDSAWLAFFDEYGLTPEDFSADASGRQALSVLLGYHAIPGEVLVEPESLAMGALLPTLDTSQEGLTLALAVDNSTESLVIIGEASNATVVGDPVMTCANATVLSLDKVLVPVRLSALDAPVPTSPFELGAEGPPEMPPSEPSLGPGPLLEEGTGRRPRGGDSDSTAPAPEPEPESPEVTAASGEEEEGPAFLSFGALSD